LKAEPVNRNSWSVWGIEELRAIDPSHSLEQADLVAGCLSGDRAAQRGFYERYARFIVRAARRLGTPPDEVEDVVQEVFSVAFRKLADFKQGELSTWLYRICHNRVQHRHRARRIRDAFYRVFGRGVSPGFGAPEVEDPERGVSRADAERRVSEILARMSKKKREVFVLFEIEGLSGEAIAERVGCPLDTVWSRLYHARREFGRIGRARDVLERVRGDR
jgi:RNA polymerase sigma-70 factor, ECF subfamily